MKPPPPPPRPPPPSGYSGTPLWRKLGYADGLAATLIAPPDGYLTLLALPPGLSVTWLAADGRGRVGFVHLFTRSRADLAAALRSLRRRLEPAGTLWVSWPKKASGVPTDVTEDVIRALALPLGLVDVKVCAVDQVWSGLKLVVRRELRPRA